MPELYKMSILEKLSGRYKDNSHAVFVTFYKSKTITK
jgi:hypothetical protein